MGEIRYVVKSNDVSHERLSDEVIIINLPKGAYYSGSGTAADLWTLISGGATVEEAAKILAAAYAADEALVLSEIDTCVQKLEAAGIIGAGDEQGNISLAALPHVPRAAWVAPVFDEYTDMWDLLRADPIHDVGETGWPYAMPNSKMG